MTYYGAKEGIVVGIFLGFVISWLLHSNNLSTESIGLLLVVTSAALLFSIGMGIYTVFAGHACFSTFKDSVIYGLIFVFDFGNVIVALTSGKLPLPW
jgi:hypothetical protein